MYPIEPQIQLRIMMTGVNVLEVVASEHALKLKKRAEAAFKSQKCRQRNRRRLIHSVRVAFCRTVVPSAMCLHIAGFIRVGFEPVSEMDRAIDVVASHRDLGAIKKSRSDQRDSWPLIDQLVVAQQFDWQSIELKAFLQQAYSSPERQFERSFPPGLRDHFERMNCKELRKLCRATPAARSSGTKSDMARDLLIYTHY